VTPAPFGYRIRPTAAADVALLAAIERDAAELYRLAGRWNVAYETTRTDGEHASGLRHGIHWVVVDSDGKPCGFALGSLVDGHLHLLELGVARAHQRRGLGALLLEAVIEHARRRADPAVTLTTERDVPWNAPFYRRHGFVEIEAGALGDDIRTILAGDIGAGLHPATRCAMAKRLG
jgi:GNAT superfamily N-acetyltransferase